MPYHVQTADNLIRVTFVGIVSNDDLLQVGRTAAEIEDAFAETPPRIVDLTTSEGLHLTFQDILAVAEIRRSRVFRNPFKSALVVSNDAQRGFARMFQTLMDNPQVTVEIFSTVAAAEAWLSA